MLCAQCFQAELGSPSGVCSLLRGDLNPSLVGLCGVNV